jgi:Bacterial mobilisation protein (MobC)
MSDPVTKLKRSRRKSEEDKPRLQGMPPIEAREKLTVIFNATSTGQGFAAALAAADFQLVKTTRHVLQVIDPKGGAHRLAVRIDAPAEEIEKRLADIPAEIIKTKKTRERENHIKFFVSPSEKDEIEARASQAGLSVSGYFRALAFGKDTPQPRAARRPPVEKEILARLLAELGKIGSNVNQIAHAMNLGQIYDHPALNQIAVEVGSIRKQLKIALGSEPPPEITPPQSSLAEKLFGKDRA